MLTVDFYDDEDDNEYETAIRSPNAKKQSKVNQSMKRVGFSDDEPHRKPKKAGHKVRPTIDFVEK